MLNFDIDSGDLIIVKEFAPRIFRNLRKNILTEDLLLETFKPCFNFQGIHNFSTGSGKSPSFFFFSDNKQFMLKNLKKSEMDILKDGKFLISYYKYLKENPNSLLNRFLGIYEVKINN